MAQKFQVTLTWVASTNKTVNAQKVNLNVAGTDLPQTLLDVATATYQFNTDEKVHVKVAVLAANAKHDSVPLTAEFDVPGFDDVTVPTSPTNLGVAFAVVDVPDVVPTPTPTPQE